MVWRSTTWNKNIQQEDFTKFGFPGEIFHPNSEESEEGSG